MFLMKRDAFLKIYKELSSEIISILSTQYELPASIVNYIRAMFNYNVPTGKLNRGMSVVNAFALLKENAVSDQEIRQASILGWALEWMEAFLLIEDDIMDGSFIRRQKPCWYKVPEVGLIAINDGFLLKSTVKIILKNYFRTEPYYLTLLELFDEVMLQTELGQLMDLTAQPKSDFLKAQQFTLDYYRHIATYKTSMYSFFLPVALAMSMYGIIEEKAFAEAKNILTEMGIFFQAQDDFLDCFGDPAVTGKIGTDIQDGKCSWLIVNAILLAAPAQLTLLQEHYGKNNPLSINCVKAVYKELDMEKTFRIFEASMHKDLSNMILSAHYLPQAVYEMLLTKIFKRNK